ncbi:HGxxPAAW family protein [Arthrobacter sp. APC 3897]|uniref:HGxxPAAW family protein n=1 Tax=Arthrobacter sp. APC 3897 TaxID=3035204 RepID=UPI0025B5A41C|nr:HGxxPAAW family protein [Arthrobacter sp. APC 3897]MDN3481978.1 HGxxPAAW family protein [Arthrobacter sp. APC 3897]
MSSNATRSNVDTKPENEAQRHASIHDETIGHGNTPAAWTCVLIMIVGAGISSVGFIIASVLWFCIGLGVMALGLVVGFIMKKAGYGVGGSKLSNSGH